MKQLFVVAVLILLTPALTGVFAQDKKVYIREFYDDKSLALLLLDLSMNYNIDFKFDREEIEGITIKSMNIKGLDLETSMKALLKNTGFDFRIEGSKTVHIYPHVEEEIVRQASTRNNISVAGWIYDNTTNETLPYSTASIKGLPSGSIANVDGHFIMMEVPSDTSTLVFSFLGYETQEIHLIPEIAAADMHIYMHPVDYRIEEVMVVGEEKKLFTYAEKTSQISLRPAQIDILPNVGEKDIFRALQLMPGVSSGNETSSGLHVRGGTPDQNLILLDGFTVYHVDHFYGFLSAFNADAIKDVQLYKGGFESKYGGKISSVMELTGKTGNTKKVSGGVSLSALSGSVHLEVPVSEKLNLFVSGRRSYTDLIQSGLYTKINDMYNGATTNTNTGGGGGPPSFQSEPKFHFYDLNAKVTYKPSQKDIFTLSFYNGKDVLDKTSDASTRTGGFGGGNDNYNLNRVDVLDWGNLGTSGKWSRQWNDKFYSNTTFAFSNYFSERDNYMERTVTEDDGSTSTITNGSIEDNKILDYTLRIDNEYRLAQNNTLEFGLQSSFIDIGYYYTQNDTLQLIDTRTKGLTLTGYLQDKIYIKDKMTLVYGLRSTWYNLTNKLYLEPRVSANYKLNDRWNLKASWGKYYQYTNRVVRENVLEGNRDFWLLADDEMIPVSSAYHYIAGISYETPRYLVDLEVFYKPMQGLAEYTMRNETFRRETTSSLPENFYWGQGTAKGFELLLQKKFGSYTGWIGYTYSRVEYQFDELNNGEAYPSMYDQPHELNIVNTFQWGNWVLGATFVYNTGQTYTAPVGAYNLTMLDGTVADYIHVGDKNAFRLPAYNRLDLSVTYRFSLGQTKSSLGLSFFNVYGRDNVWYREFDVEDNELIIMDVNTLGFTPNVFFSIKF
ncbi:MAG: TonB-dependent receptor [Bacteroides sp.]|nr:TonB-dependent receptor [Bacteroides sp.]